MRGLRVLSREMAQTTLLYCVSFNLLRGASHNNGYSIWTYILYNFTKFQKIQRQVCLPVGLLL